jgi:hypothetical protein
MAKKRRTDTDKLTVANEFFRTRINQIGDWCVGDIRRCCRLKQDGTYEPNGAMVGAFILWVCAIDYLGGLLTNSHNDSRLRIKSFVDKYVNKYRAGSIEYDSKEILDLRDGLVHSYCPNFLLVSSIDKKLHLARLGEMTFLVLEQAIEDLEVAFLRFKKDLLTNDKMKITAFDYYKKYPPLGPVKIEFKQSV